MHEEYLFTYLTILLRFFAGINFDVIGLQIFCFRAIACIDWNVLFVEGLTKKMTSTVVLLIGLIVSLSWMEEVKAGVGFVLIKTINYKLI